MVAGIAAVVVLAVAGGGYFAMKASAKPAAAAQQGDTNGTKVQQLNQPLAAAPQVDVDAELASIGKLTDIASGGTPASAAQALQRLDKLPAESQMTSDQRVLAALERAEANVLRENSGAACTAVKDVQGLSKGTRYEKRVGNILKFAAC